jgi:Flp pilus assembly protein TadD
MSKAIRLDPTNGRYLYGRAWIMVRSGRLQEAQAEMTRAANLGSADAILYLQRIGAGR